MAIGAGVSIGATAIANRAADMPLIMGSNEARSTSKIYWNRNGQFTDGNGNEEDSAGPTSRLGTNNDFRQSYPDTNRVTWYLMFEFTAADGVIDSVAILNHNLDTADAIVDVELADDQDFTTNLKSCEQQTPTTDKRLVFLDLDDTAGGGQLRYSNVQYARIKLTSLASVPKIGEVIFARRRQLGHNPMMPYNDKSGRSRVEDWYSDSGVRVRYVRTKGQRVGSISLREASDTYVDDLITFFRDDIDHGTLPFLWIDEPSTTQSDAFWMQLIGPQPDLDFPLVDYIERNWTLQVEELGPNYLRLGV